jgi:hypothetical protein
MPAPPTSAPWFTAHFKLYAPSANDQSRDDFICSVGTLILEMDCITLPRWEGTQV